MTSIVPTLYVSVITQATIVPQHCHKSVCRRIDRLQISSTHRDSRIHIHVRVCKHLLRDMIVKAAYTGHLGVSIFWPQRAGGCCVGMLEFRLKQLGVITNKKVAAVNSDHVSF